MSRELGATERAILAALAVEKHPDAVIPDRVWGVDLRALAEIIYGTLSDASREATRSRAVALDRRQVVEIIPDPSAADPHNFRVRLAPTTEAERAELAKLDANAEAALRRGKDNARMEAQRAADLLQEQDNAARSAKLDETVRRAAAGEVVPPDDPAG
jgi:hypothetical protein